MDVNVHDLGCDVADRAERVDAIGLDLTELRVRRILIDRRGIEVLLVEHDEVFDELDSVDVEWLRLVDVATLVDDHVKATSAVQSTPCPGVDDLLCRVELVLEVVVDIDAHLPSVCDVRFGFLFARLVA